jgi:phosphopantothenoylcysteine decarboxylase
LQTVSNLINQNPTLSLTITKYHTQLQAIHETHVVHHIRTMHNSLPALTASRTDGKAHLLLAVSGSVATIKLVDIIRALSRHPNLSIRVIMTSSAERFLAGQSEEQPTVSSSLQLPNVDAVYDDAAEWGPEPWRRGAEILHIELRRWGDILVIAPLSANTLAKVVAGMADNLLTSVVRAWDTTGEVDGVHKKIIVARTYPTYACCMTLHSS